VELLFFIMFFLLAWYMLAFKKHGKRWCPPQAA
jgi:hypothetical protein